MQEILDKIGQVAVEVTCLVPGQREYVSVSAANSENIIGFAARFPYLKNSSIVYRVFRFRVKSEFVENDVDVGPDDLLELQQIYVSSLETVEIILNIWGLTPAEMKSPRDVEIPV